MGFFNFLNFKKKNEHPALFHSIGKFSFTLIDNEPNYIGIVDFKINKNVELIFPVTDGTKISEDQFEYFRNIENSWNSILNQSKDQKPKIDFENYSVICIMIPEKNHKSYDVDAEIVMKKRDNIISIIMSNLTVDKVIEI